MDFVTAFKYKQWANAELLLCAQSQIQQLPEDEARFFIRILHHTSVVDSLFISRITGSVERYTTDNTIETPTLAELQHTMNLHDQWLVDYTLRLSAEELVRHIDFKFVDGDGGRLSVSEILLHLLTHGSNHRGMASRVLSSHGLERPKDTYTRYLHLTEPERRTHL
ncbi:hypothetical protein PULV_a0867 [Pseudoalteromonas ulvae UL12]|uniref:DinB family protein n=1 Tax=Pseudoalteromonas ulvae TaxID=107327 RepID=UPI00186B9CA4|nr:DinB family protein [Pseudoalteromonas ulvae]MBE0363429.1 hypothetical protein [Pseudoalteromonas ulvae UL12]